MGEFASSFLYPPFPLLCLLIAGLLVRKFTRFQRTGRKVEVFAIAGIVLTVVPLTGKLVLLPLLHSVPRWQDGIQVGAIVVPTGGAYVDIGGRWRPSIRSVQRVALAVQIQSKLRIPLLISGGKLREDGVSEAKIVAEAMGLALDKVWLDESALNTHDNARVLADRLLELKINTVLLVTSLPHLPRMAACLRANGVEVYATPVPEPEIESVYWSDLVPSNRGLGLSVDASKVFAGLILYLLRGWISPADLVS